LQSRFELDYWGSSYMNGLEWILKDSKSDTIRLNHRQPLEYNTLILSKADRRRIIFPDDEATFDYYIEVFRENPYRYSREQSAYNIEVLNSTILRVTKLK
jgi:hypothetical protein